MIFLSVHYPMLEHPLREISARRSISTGHLLSCVVHDYGRVVDWLLFKLSFIFCADTGDSFMTIFPYFLVSYSTR